MISPLPRNKRAKNPHAGRRRSARRRRGQQPCPPLPPQSRGCPSRTNRQRTVLRTIRSPSSKCNDLTARRFAQSQSVAAPKSFAPVPGTGNLSHTAFECSQKSRTICIKPCCAAALRNARPAGSPEQPLPRQFQNRIVLRRRPGKITPLDLALELFIFAFGRARPRATAESRSPPDPSRAPRPAAAAAFQTRRSKRPVPRPEFVALDLQNFDAANPASRVVRQVPRRTSFQFWRSNFPPPASAPPARAGAADDWPGAGREISRPRAAKGNR